MVRGIAYRIARHLPPNVDVDDLMQAGWEGYLQARARYSGERGASFLTFAGWRIQGAMQDELRRQAQMPRRARQEGRALEWLPFDDAVDSVVEDGPERGATIEREREALWAAVDALPERLRQIVRWYYLDGETICVIGRRLGVSESRVSQLSKEALGRLRRRLAWMS
jgi:RNA polymerase sigma factor for flagellar operon FliA